MKIVVQRVLSASVEIDNNLHSSIDNGLLVLIGISNTDDEETVEWVSNKLINLRIFNDDDGKMNKSILDIEGEILLVPNFTIYGDVKKGYRPNFMSSAKPNISAPLFNSLIEKLKDLYPSKIQCGIFGADMKVKLTNDGPVTIIIEK
jgi:D-tyrosyl-tRNA(Tyr) deacylase